MKFSLALVALFCVSAISAAPVEEPSPFFRAIINLVEDFVKLLEKQIPDWDARASLEKNLVTTVDKSIEPYVIPGWNPLDSYQDNLVKGLLNYTKSLKIQGFDEREALTKNIDAFVTAFIAPLPIPIVLPKHILVDQVAVSIIIELGFVELEGFDVTKPFINDLAALVDASLADLKDFTPKAALENFVEFIIKNSLIDVFPDISPEKTLEETVAEVLEKYFRNLTITSQTF